MELADDQVGVVAVVRCRKVTAAHVAEYFDRRKADTVGFVEGGRDIADRFEIRMANSDQAGVQVINDLGSIQSPLILLRRNILARGLETPRKNDVCVFSCPSFLSSHACPSLICCRQGMHLLPTLRESRRPSLLRQSDW